jgi:TonB family protein
VVKKGKKDATLKVGEKTIEVKAEQTADAKAEKAAEKKAEPAKTKPFALHAVVDQFGRITGFSSEGEPDSRQPMEFTIGNIFFGDREATLEEVKNYKALGYDMYEMVYNPNTDAAPKLIFKKNEQAAAGATEQKEREIVFDVVEQMPEFPGGAEGMMKFLTSTVKYPAVSQKNGVQGRVVVKFVVEKDGSVSSARVVKSVNEELDAEALRVVNAMPAWTPGKQNGRIVRVYYTIPIAFRLQ